jgi:protein gp37
MSELTKIEWTDHTWSPWRGCTKVSPGCANCYAEKLSHRNPAVLGQWGKGKPRVKAKNWYDPVKWNRREAGKLVSHVEFVENSQPRVFPSLCDWLDEEVPVDWLMDFLELIHRTPNLDWLLLTKRPENFERIRGIHDHLRTLYVESPGTAGGYTEAGLKFYSWFTRFVTEGVANVWHGVSVEDQPRADERIPELLRIPAKVRFLILEPLLGPVSVMENESGWPLVGSDGKPLINWLIIGGESGPGARPCNVEWIRDLVLQGREAGVPVFVKQLGAVAVSATDPGHKLRGGYGRHGGIEGYRLTLNHPKGGDPKEWPNDIQIREFPNV